MTDYSALYVAIESRMLRVLAQVSGVLTESEKNEVALFLKAREFGLALETLSCILVDESKPIDFSVLKEIDQIATAMQLRDERFMDG